ncbi:TetR/AcrR family transcriptional regulator [Microbacterium sorbitolivorans]|uniref:TetR/AcrR family transcriptional regulator n=1 Tax=Microbacterium sorbitolivorans TaxID=1867410 RepID=UPI001C9E7556|nr:TetR/AcrR family transcriptional regulator [Microbacterium sorbitolivorans]
MPKRTVILDRAAELLATSPSGDVSTRAVCEAAGVTQPVLYRLFGDKDGLLSAVADHVWEQYLAGKRAAVPGSDVLADLRAGWDNHTAFALAHPHAYRLVFGSALSAEPAAIAEAMRLLGEVTERLASEGLLRVSPEEAARVIMAANSGVALGMILRPTEYPEGASEEVREATIRGILAGDAVADPVAVAVATLRSRVRGGDAADTFTAAEAALIDEWLGRLTRTGSGT